MATVETTHEYLRGYGEAKFWSGFTIGYVVGISVGTIIAVVASSSSSSSPKWTDSIASALNGRK
jgi:hypothetical protein